MNRNSLVLIALAVAAVAVLPWLLRHMGSEQDRQTACAEQRPQPRIVAFGDSLVVGYGATTPGGFVSLLSQDLGVPIENLGRNGDTTASAQERLKTVLSRDPDVVILLLGGNDALRRVPAATVEKNLNSIITAITDTGATVVLLGVTGGLPFSDPYPSMFERLSDRPNVTYVSNVLSGIFGRKDLMSDEIHPNEEGYRRIADRVLPAVRRTCDSLSTAGQ